MAVASQRQPVWRVCEFSEEIEQGVFDESRFGVEFYQVLPRLPILIGGATEPVLRRAARLGDGWIVGGTATLEVVKSNWEKILGYAFQIGRDTSRLTLATLLYVSVVDGDEKEYRKRYLRERLSRCLP